MSSYQFVNNLLLDLYPGDDPAIMRTRDEIARLAATPGPVIVLLEGPPGSGKTTMARAFAVCRRAFVSSATALKPTIEGARKEILSQKPLTWYRDISLAGLVETLADSQLFGIGAKVASEVTPRVGIFEQAMTGHIASEPVGTHEQLIRAAKEKGRWAPLVTGGVVLLDEIGDLASPLQAKLLRILNGERQYRVGQEGSDAYSFQYTGMTLLATWRDLEAMKDFRRDLWERICHNRLRLPSLASYSIKNRLELVRSIHHQLRDQMSDELERLRELSTNSSFEIASTEWLMRLVQLSKQGLSLQTETDLCHVPAETLGEFRGLRHAVLRVMLGMPLEIMMPSQRPDLEVPTTSIQMDLNLSVFARTLKATSLSQGWREFRLLWAKDINHRLVSRSPEAEYQVRKAGRERARVKKDLENILRSELNEETLENE